MERREREPASARGQTDGQTKRGPHHRTGCRGPTMMDQDTDQRRDARARPAAALLLVGYPRSQLAAASQPSNLASLGASHTMCWVLLLRCRGDCIGRKRTVTHERYTTSTCTSRFAAGCGAGQSRQLTERSRSQQWILPIQSVGGLPSYAVGLLVAT